MCGLRPLRGSLPLQLHLRPNRGKNLTIAEVDSEHCMACGLCSSVCRSNSIELTEDYTDEIVVDSLSDWLANKPIKDAA